MFPQVSPKTDGLGEGAQTPSCKTDFIFKYCLTNGEF